MVMCGGARSDQTCASELHEKSVTTTESVVRDEPLRAFHAQKLVSRYNNAARVRIKAGDIAAARAHTRLGKELVGRLAANDASNVSFATQRVSKDSYQADVAVRGRNAGSMSQASWATLQPGRNGQPTGRAPGWGGAHSVR